MYTLEPNIGQIGGEGVFFFLEPSGDFVEISSWMFLRSHTGVLEGQKVYFQGSKLTVT